MRVFFSFHYSDDIFRAMVVRNSGALEGITEFGFIYRADFEEIEKQGTQAVARWIDQQLVEASVTVVLIGTHTLECPYVQYAIAQSTKMGYSIIGVQIHGIKDTVTKKTSYPGDIFNCSIPINESLYSFKDVAFSTHDFVRNNGHDNLGHWIKQPELAKLNRSPFS